MNEAVTDRTARRTVLQRLTDRIPPRRLAPLLQAIYSLPPSVLRRLTGPPTVIDGQQLAVEAQLLVRLSAAIGPDMVRGDAYSSRAQMRRSAATAAGRRVEPVTTAEVCIPGAGIDVGARLYTPGGLERGSALLIFYHGGGWVLGDLDTHDNLCRFLAVHAGVRVLSVDYRRAPEHPFPAAVDDAGTAYRYARAHAAELGADPDRVALGGDSAGATLTVVTALDAAERGMPVPAFLLLFYPAADATTPRPSRDLFGSGFLLTNENITWFADQYVPDAAARADPRVSPLLAGNLSTLPATYLATAGFDPLRDEGRALGRAMTEAGVPIVHREHRDLFHGFANALAVPAFRAAALEAAGALRTGLVLAPSAPTPSTRGRGV